MAKSLWRRSFLKFAAALLPVSLGAKTARSGPFSYEIDKEGARVFKCKCRELPAVIEKVRQIVAERKWTLNHCIATVEFRSAWESNAKVFRVEKMEMPPEISIQEMFSRYNRATIAGAYLQAVNWPGASAYFFIYDGNFAHPVIRVDVTDADSMYKIDVKKRSWWNGRTNG